VSGAAASWDQLPALRIAHLYPSLLNVAGDGGNVAAVQRRCAWRGIPTEVVAVELADTPDFTDFDLVFFHGGQDVEMAIAADDLRSKAPSLHEAVDEGVPVFAVCAGLQLLGHRYVPQTGPVIDGVGILDLETRADRQRFMQHAAVEVTIDGRTDIVVGFENHSGLTELGPQAQAFGTVVAGAGNNGRDRTEGATQGSVLATYLHGPVLPKNPWLADQLIRRSLERKAPSGAVELSALDDAIELRAHDVALRHAVRNNGRRTALNPASLLRADEESKQ
jgi:lipid II isoglutaminyl synthase (glutamine-hydrolysing)